MVAGAVHLPVDVQDLGCDWYVFTGHKVYGPSGIGVLYGRAEMLEKMRPFQGGGEMIEEVTEENVTYNHPPHRFEAGTPPIVQAIGLGAALEYMEKSAVMRSQPTKKTCVFMRMNNWARSIACAFMAMLRTRGDHLVCA